LFMILQDAFDAADTVVCPAGLLRATVIASRQNKNRCLKIFLFFM
jgi:hypothetical protein